MFTEQEQCVYVDIKYSMFILWNQSSTFNVYVYYEGIPENVDCFTNYNISNYQQAAEAAREWVRYAEIIET